MSNWFKPAGTLKTAEHEIALSPQEAGWEFCGFYTYNFATKPEFTIELSGREGVLLPLSAQNVSVLVDGQKFTLKSRFGVFAGVSDWIYLPAQRRERTSHPRFRGSETAGDGRRAFGGIPPSTDVSAPTLAPPVPGSSQSFVRTHQ